MYERSGNGAPAKRQSNCGVSQKHHVTGFGRPVREQQRPGHGSEDAKNRSCASQRPKSACQNAPPIRRPAPHVKCRNPRQVQRRRPHLDAAMMQITASANSINPSMPTRRVPYLSTRTPPLSTQTACATVTSPRRPMAPARTRPATCSARTWPLASLSNKQRHGLSVAEVLKRDIQ
jgi:hypothetical protein